MLPESLIDLTTLAAFWDADFARMALLSTLLIGLMCGLLSPTIVLKQRAYTGDTLAHLVFPGIVAGYFMSLGFGLPLWASLIVGASVTGLLGTVLVEKLERILALPPDSAAVVTLTGFFASGVVAVSKVRGTRIDLERFLFGDVLTLSVSEAVLIAVALGCVALTLVLLRRDWDAWLSDGEFALLVGFRVRLIERLFPILVTAAVLTGLFAVGGLMMSALMALPAVISPPKSALSWGTVVLSVTLALLGLIFAFALDWPVGSTIVLLGFILVLIKAIVVSLRHRAVVQKIQRVS